MLLAWAHTLAHRLEINSQTAGLCSRWIPVGSWFCSSWIQMTSEECGQRIPSAYPISKEDCPRRILARVIRIRGEKSVWRIPCAYVLLDSYQHSGRTGSPAHCGRIVVHIPRLIFDMVHPGENRKLIVSVRTLAGQA